MCLQASWWDGATPDAGLMRQWLLQGCKDRRAALGTLRESRARKHTMTKLELAQYKHLEEVCCLLYHARLTLPSTRCS